MGRRRRHRRGKKVSKKIAKEGESGNKRQNVQKAETEEASGLQTKKAEVPETKPENPLLSETKLEYTNTSILKTEGKVHKTKTEDHVTSETEISDLKITEAEVAKRKTEKPVALGIETDERCATQRKIGEVEVGETKGPVASRTVTEETYEMEPKIDEAYQAETKTEALVEYKLVTEETYSSELKTEEEKIKKIDKSVQTEKEIEKLEVAETKTEELVESGTVTGETYSTESKIKEEEVAETKIGKFVLSKAEETNIEKEDASEAEIAKIKTEGILVPTIVTEVIATTEELIISAIVTGHKDASEPKIREAEVAKTKAEELMVSRTVTGETEIGEKDASEPTIREAEVAKTKTEELVVSATVTEETEIEKKYASEPTIREVEIAETKTEELEESGTMTGETEIGEKYASETKIREAVVAKTITNEPEESGTVIEEIYTSKLKIMEEGLTKLLETSETEIRETGPSEPKIGEAELAEVKTEAQVKTRIVSEEKYALEPMIEREEEAETKQSVKSNIEIMENNKSKLKTEKEKGPETETKKTVTAETETEDTKNMKDLPVGLENVQIPEIETGPSLVMCESVDPDLREKWPKYTECVPTIFLHKPLKFDNFVRMFLDKAIQFYRPYLGKHFTRILCKTLEDYEAMLKYFRSKNVRHHTFCVPSERVMKVVIRGLPNGTDLNKLQDTLTSESIATLRIHKMKTKNYILNHALVVLVVLPNKEEGLKLLRVKKIFGHDVTMEPPHKKNIQCFRCQKWGHAQRYCYGKIMCCFCGGNHRTDTCLKDLTRSGPRCANCRQRHVACCRKCTYCPDSIENKKTRIKTRKLNKRFDGERKQIVTLQNYQRLYININYAVKKKKEKSNLYLPDF